MKQIIYILLVLAVTLPLTGCYTMAVGAAGAGAGYIIKDKEEEGEL